MTIVQQAGHGVSIDKLVTLVAQSAVAICSKVVGQRFESCQELLIWDDNVALAPVEFTPDCVRFAIIILL